MLAFVETPENVSEGSKKGPKSRNRPQKTGFRPKNPILGGRFHWVPGVDPKSFSAGGAPPAEMKKVVDPPRFFTGRGGRPEVNFKMAAKTLIFRAFLAKFEAEMKKGGRGPA